MNTQFTTTTFSKWSGPDGLAQFCLNRTGCKLFSGAGINTRIRQKTTILKSVDDTYYYCDDLSDINNIEYTLFGHNGEQDENEKKFNEPLLNENKTQNIYVYRNTKKSKDKYIWYGKYEIVNRYTKQNIGKNREMRNVIVLCLRKVGN